MLRIDPRTHRVIARPTVGLEPIDVAAGFGSLWSSVTSDATVARVDPASGQVLARIKLPADGPTGLLVTREAVWVMAFDGQAVMRIDPRTNRVIGSLNLPGRAENAVEVGATLWITTADGTLIAVHPT